MVRNHIYSLGKRKPEGIPHDRILEDGKQMDELTTNLAEQRQVNPILLFRRKPTTARQVQK